MYRLSAQRAGIDSEEFMFDENGHRHNAYRDQKTARDFLQVAHVPAPFRSLDQQALYGRNRESPAERYNSRSQH